MIGNSKSAVSSFKSGVEQLSWKATSKMNLMNQSTPYASDLKWETYQFEGPTPEGVFSGKVQLKISFKTVSDVKKSPKIKKYRFQFKSSEHPWHLLVQGQSEFDIRYKLGRPKNILLITFKEIHERLLFAILEVLALSDTFWVGVSSKLNSKINSAI